MLANYSGTGGGGHGVAVDVNDEAWRVKLEFSVAEWLCKAFYVKQLFHNSFMQAGGNSGRWNNLVGRGIGSVVLGLVISLIENTTKTKANNGVTEILVLVSLGVCALLSVLQFHYVTVLFSFCACTWCN